MSMINISPYITLVSCPFDEVVGELDLQVDLAIAQALQPVKDWPQQLVGRTKQLVVQAEAKWVEPYWDEFSDWNHWADPVNIENDTLLYHFYQGPWRHAYRAKPEEAMKPWPRALIVHCFCPPNGQVLVFQARSSRWLLASHQVKRRVICCEPNSMRASLLAVETVCLLRKTKKIERRIL